jgi:hypothetical protein
MEKQNNIINWLETLTTDVSNEDIRWTISKDDNDFFDSCVLKLKELKLTTVLDIACGGGNFVKSCNHNNIKAFGVDPRYNPDINIYLGTFNDIIINQNNLNGYVFDCISIHNTLHGKYHTSGELNQLFDFLKKYAKYIIISHPILLSNLLDGLQLVHGFEGSHGAKSVFHKLYKVI